MGSDETGEWTWDRPSTASHPAHAYNLWRRNIYRQSLCAATHLLKLQVQTRICIVVIATWRTHPVSGPHIYWHFPLRRIAIEAHRFGQGTPAGKSCTRQWPQPAKTTWAISRPVSRLACYIRNLVQIPPRTHRPPSSLFCTIPDTQRTQLVSPNMSLATPVAGNPCVWQHIEPQKVAEHVASTQSANTLHFRVSCPHSCGCCRRGISSLPAVCPLAPWRRTGRRPRQLQNLPRRLWRSWDAQLLRMRAVICSNAYLEVSAYVAIQIGSHFQPSIIIHNNSVGGHSY